MTPTEFLAHFQKHLRVAEPKRRELLAEVQQHIQEDGVETLGQPRAMAHALNRVHLGPLSSPLYLMMLVAATILFVLGVRVLTEAHMGFWSRRIPADEMWTSMLFYYSFLVPTVVAVIVGRTISGIHQPAALFLRLGFITFVLSAVCGIAYNGIIGSTDLDIPNTVRGSIMASIFSSLFLTTMYSAVAFVGLVTHAAPDRDPEGKTRQWQAHFAAIAVTLFIGFVLLTTWVGLAFQPIPHIAVWPVIILVGFVTYRTIRKVVRAHRSTPTRRSA